MKKIVKFCATKDQLENADIQERGIKSIKDQLSLAVAEFINELRENPEWVYEVLPLDDTPNVVVCHETLEFSIEIKRYGKHQDNQTRTEIPEERPSAQISSRP